MKKVFITGISSDIGINLTKRFIEQGYEVSGTYRKMDKEFSDFVKKRGNLYKCDFSHINAVKNLINKIDKKQKYDIFISSVGTMLPIGKFFDVNIEEWEKTIYVNSLSQLELLHGMKDQLSENGMILFWAGGGTNNPFTNYSAYCLSKIMLIKMSELLYDENPNLKIVIAGPGFVKTKIHEETLKEKIKAGDNYNKTISLLNLEINPRERFDKIFKFVMWALNEDKEIVSGRNFSIVNDEWENENELVELLKGNNDMYKLRRYGNGR